MHITTKCVKVYAKLKTPLSNMQEAILISKFPHGQTKIGRNYNQWTRQRYNKKIYKMKRLKRWFRYDTLNCITTGKGNK